MKKLISLVLLIILTITLSGCGKEKDVDYNCTFTYYEDGQTGQLAVESYTISTFSMFAIIEKTNGDEWIIDLSKISMLCQEWEFDE